MMPSDLGSDAVRGEYAAPPSPGTKPISEPGPSVGIPTDFVPSINEDQFSRLLVEGKRKESPAADSVFPWLHAIAPNNLALPYLAPDQSPDIEAPVSSAGLMLVSAGKYWETTSLRGTVHAADVLEVNEEGSGYQDKFINRDEKTAINIRNFEVQCSKYAQICDIIVYVPGLYDEGDSASRVAEAFNVARLIRKAQLRLNSSRITLFYPNTLFDVAMKLGATVSSSMLLAPVADSRATTLKGDRSWDNNMQSLENFTLLQMANATPIEQNVWAGSFMDIRRKCLPNSEDDPSLISERTSRSRRMPSEQSAPSSTAVPSSAAENESPGSGSPWIMVVECVFACLTLPTLSELDHAIRLCNRSDRAHGTFEFSFPGTSAFVGSKLESKHVAQIVNLCYLIYTKSQLGNVLLASEDGHRASSLLVLLYIVYARASTVEDALLYLHMQVGRAFSLGNEDIQLLKSLENVLRAMSPRSETFEHSRGAIPVSRIPSPTQALAQRRSQHSEPHWALDSRGSFPSRILPHLYLGSYAHATNVAMLKALGVKRLISLGECPLDARPYDVGNYYYNDDFELILKVPGFRDNGIDGLKQHLEPCLSLLADSEEKNIVTLVHCQQGVSRSAAICIAEVMRSTRMCLPEAYIWTRVHRMDVIIQPNLRLMYELLKFEEDSLSSGRSIEWPVLCREIAKLNREYT